MDEGANLAPIKVKQGLPVNRERLEFRNLQVPNYVAVETLTRRRGFEACMQTFQDRMVAGNTAGWWEITDLVEHPDHADRDATGQLLQWACMVADLERDALIAIMAAGSPELETMYRDLGFVPYRTVEVRDGIGSSYEMFKAYEMERSVSAMRNYQDRVDQLEQLSSMRGGFALRTLGREH